MPDLISQAVVQRGLDDFAAAWSRGDLEAACAVYAKDACFIANGQLVHGKAAVMEYYRDAFPDADSMGSLTLEIANFRRIMAGSHATAMASAIVHWKLLAKSGEIKEGYALEVYEYLSGRLTLVQDATV